MMSSYAISPLNCTKGKVAWLVSVPGSGGIAKQQKHRFDFGDLEGITIKTNIQIEQLGLSLSYPRCF